MPQLSVIVPCLNEEENVSLFPKTLFPALDKLGLTYEIVAVDDGSVDRTSAALEEFAAQKRPITVVRHERNRGLGAAVRTAIAAAKGDWAVVLDADMTFDPSQIEALWKAQLETGADCVIGSPALGSFGDVPWTRRLPSLILNGVYRILFARSVVSFTPIFRIYRSSLLRRLPLRAEGFEINAEAVVLLLRQGGKVAEVPARLGARARGVSSLRRFHELKRHMRLIARLLFAR